MPNSKHIFLTLYYFSKNLSVTILQYKTFGFVIIDMKAKGAIQNIGSHSPPKKKVFAQLGQKFCRI